MHKNDEQIKFYDEEKKTLVTHFQIYNKIKKNINLKNV